MPNNLTDKEIKKALECCSKAKTNEDCKKLECPFYDDAIEMCGVLNSEQVLMSNALDLINRQEEKIKKFENRQKPTGASGYKIENGKVVFFTNMLGGCKIVKENLEEVVKTLNELLQEAYSKDEIAFALKCKTEENENLKAEVERLKTENKLLTDYSPANRYANCVLVKNGEVYTKTLEDYDKLIADISAEAYKECIEKVKEKSKKTEIVCSGALIATNYSISAKNFNSILKEVVGDGDGN